MYFKLPLDKKKKTLKPVAFDANNYSGSAMSTVHGLAKVECTQNVYKCYESKISFKTTFSLMK